jgi:hypothetical protein
VTFEIGEVFAINGRGTVVLPKNGLGESVVRNGPATLETADGTRIPVMLLVEMVCRRTPAPDGSVGFLLRSVTKKQAMGGRLHVD